MLIMPISGFLGSAFSKYPIQYFGYILPKFFEPNIVYKEILSQVHFGAMGILIFLICIHLLAVIKHQFINKDNLLGRMWFSKSVE
jgi:cytochrome b561